MTSSSPRCRRHDGVTGNPGDNTESKINVVGIVCESRINALPCPFGSITESKIRWWGSSVARIRATRIYYSGWRVAGCTSRQRGESQDRDACGCRPRRESVGRKDLRGGFVGGQLHRRAGCAADRARGRCHTRTRGARHHRLRRHFAGTSNVEIWQVGHARSR